MKQEKNQLLNNCIMAFFSLVLIGSFLICVEAYRNGSILISNKGFTVGGVLFYTKLSFGIDRFRALYGFVCTFIWFISMIVTRNYMKNGNHMPRFYFGTVLVYLATMGIFYSNNLLQVYVFFEVMSLSSYLWVVHNQNTESKQASDMYLMVSILSGLVMLMGVIILYCNLENLEFGSMQLLANTVKKKELYIGAGCMLFGFATKAGAFPMQFYLHKAYPVTPAPAAAILSAALTKAGIFGILILTIEVLPGDLVWAKMLMILGVITMLLNAVIGIFQMDIMKILACSSVSQLGFIILGCGLIGVSLSGYVDTMHVLEMEGGYLSEMILEGTNMVVRGTVLYMVNHSLFKLILFLACGLLVEKAESRNLLHLQGIGKQYKVFLIPVLVGCAGLAGIPLFSGYVSKTLLHEGMVIANELVGGSIFFKVVEILFLVTGGCTFAYVTKIFVALFLKKSKRESITIKDYGNENQEKNEVANSIAIWIPTLISLICGVLPNVTMHLFSNVRNYEEDSAFRMAYFSLENLKGSFISISIGLIVYLGLVKPFLSEKNLFPKWMDLNKMIITPLFSKGLPFLGGILASVLDQFIPWLQKPLVMGMNCIAYSLDQFLPRLQKAGEAILSFLVQIISNMTDFGIALLQGSVFNPSKHLEIKKNENIEVAMQEVSQTTKVICASLSFGFLMICLGLCVTLLYLLFG